MEIKIDDLTKPEVISLINEHLHGMTLHSPPESIHALGLEKLKKPEITVWTAWDGNQLMGCGALKELDRQHGELKSMRTATAHLRKGVAQAMLEHIIKEARQRGYKKLSLETGSMEAFAPARKLYEKYSFHYCPPFGEYTEDPNSLFMTRTL
jgi:putative acetyltransferase